MSVDPASLLQFGVLGVVLAWFMFRLEGIVKSNTQALNEVKEVLSKLCQQNDIIIGAMTNAKAAGKED